MGKHFESTRRDLRRLLDDLSDRTDLSLVERGEAFLAIKATQQLVNEVTDLVNRGDFAEARHIIRRQRAYLWILNNRGGAA